MIFKPLPFVFQVHLVNWMSAFLVCMRVMIVRLCKDEDDDEKIKLV
jgi:hypothetical protein